ncbi:hypothetical protein CMI37_14535 [Candidatus Pacearchaeota archaeon]|nr:hypothetical protein [Candidatus Pacearchaeota archaeon]|tara:strand:+ start:428 stop:1033 length:606 start_codon:yes stop_codon:yes gene_type:complete
MILFPAGIPITITEYKALLHLEADPEQWLLDALATKARRRREALINEWRPRLFEDPTVMHLPANEADLAKLIVSRPDYRSRVQSDAELESPALVHQDNKERYDAVDRSGEIITLFATGIHISQHDYDYILSYVQELNEWVYGAILGHINRGTKKMILQYQPVLMADPDVATFPATKEGMVEVITARADYQTLPERYEAVPQ